MISRKLTARKLALSVGRTIGATGLAAALAVLPGLAAEEAGPRTPGDEAASFVLADSGLRVELVAAEPEITSPVAMAWDADGALFVAEMNDYPTEPDGGRVKRLWDADGDGRYETSTVFADGLHFPSSVQPWREGLLVAAAPEIVFFRDRDGDGKADERRVLFTGFAEGNQQLRVNALTWRPDNWVYGANGRSDGEVRGGALEAPLSLRRHDFRFRPDSGAIETLSGPSQFGVGFDRAGNRFLSWNTIPVRHEVIPERYAVRAGGAVPVETLQDCLAPLDAGHVYPLAPAPRTFNRESARHFNALAGLHIYEGDALGDGYRGSAFVGETLRSLVHRRILEPKGATFVARRAPGEENREFLAAADPWFHPVNFATGPDGALYLCDFYRRWVEHPGFVPENLRSRHDWREGWNHGRLWRVVPKGADANLASRRAVERRPGLSRASGGRLVERLGHANAWQRLTAQRILAERGPKVPTRALRARWVRPERWNGLARWHALWTLENAGRLDGETLWAALSDPDPTVRRSAVQIAEARWPIQGGASTDEAGGRGAGESRSAWIRLADDPDPAVRLQVASSAMFLPSTDRREVLGKLLTRNADDPWITRAVLASGHGDARFLALTLLSNPTGASLGVLHELGLRSASGDSEAEPWPPAVPTGNAGAETLSGYVSLAAGYVEGRKRAGGASPPSRSVDLALHEELAGRLLKSENVPEIARVHAVRLLATRVPASGLAEYLVYLEPAAPTELQGAVVDWLAASADASLAGALFERAPRMTVTTRRRLVARAPGNVLTASALVEAVRSGVLPRAEVDARTRQACLDHPQASVRTAAATVFVAPVAEDLERRIERYRASLAATEAGGGDRLRGAVLFGQNCVVCHRIGAHGVAIGPDLAGIGARPPEAVLVDLLDPSRQVTPEYVSYALVTRDGEEWTGLLAAEGPTSVTLRRASLPDEIVARDRIVSLRATGKSLMPDGFETVIAPERIADLMAFLSDPSPELLAEAEQGASLRAR